MLMNNHVISERLDAWRVKDLDSKGSGYGYKYSDAASDVITAIVIKTDAIYEIHLHATITGYETLRAPQRIMYSQEVRRHGSRSEHFEAIIEQPKLIDCPNNSLVSTSTGCNTATAQRIVHLRQGDVITVYSSHKHLLQPEQTWFSIVRIDKV